MVLDAEHHPRDLSRLRRAPAIARVPPVFRSIAVIDRDTAAMTSGSFAAARVAASPAAGRASTPTPTTTPRNSSCDASSNDDVAFALRSANASGGRSCAT